MNIIELFEKLNIDKATTLQFTSEDIIRIEKQVNVEKRINPDIDVNVASNLIDALRNYPNEFHFICNHRVLYNFFAKTDYGRDWFPHENIVVDTDRVRSFIGSFLEEELTLFFDQKLSQNRFDDLNLMMIYKAYFPEDLLFKLSKKAIGKIDVVITTLSVNSSDLSKIMYAKQAAFYEFLSHLTSIEMDEKVKQILNSVVDIYNANKRSEFAGTVMTSMYYYKAFDEEFADTIKRNRNVVHDNRNNSGRSTSSFSWKTFGIILFILLRVTLFATRCSSDNTRNTYDTFGSGTTNLENINSVQTETVDRYYTTMRQKLDSFHVFLVDYNKEEMQNIKYDDTIKTGDNPFQNLYRNTPIPSNGSPILFKNKTNYDIILFENPLALDSIKMPGRAYFIKAGATYKLDDITLQLQHVYNFYIGKGLASFKTNSNHIFVRNNSVMEPRFTKLSPYSNAILEQDYRFNSDVTITEKSGKIIITSNGSTYSSPQPINYKTEGLKANEEVIEEPPKVKDISEKN